MADENVDITKILSGVVNCLSGLQSKVDELVDRMRVGSANPANSIDSITKDNDTDNKENNTQQQQQ